MTHRDDIRKYRDRVRTLEFRIADLERAVRGAADQLRTRGVQHLTEVQLEWLQLYDELLTGRPMRWPHGHMETSR